MIDLTALEEAAALVAVEHGFSCPDAAFWAVQRFKLHGDPREALPLAETYLTTHAPAAGTGVPA
jgi:hypothetical protein